MDIKESTNTSIPADLLMSDKIWSIYSEKLKIIQLQKTSWLINMFILQVMFQKKKKNGAFHNKTEAWSCTTALMNMLCLVLLLFLTFTTFLLLQLHIKKAFNWRNRSWLLLWSYHRNVFISDHGRHLKGYNFCTWNLETGQIIVGKRTSTSSL